MKKTILFALCCCVLLPLASQEKKEQESAEGGFVTNPETDSPILVRMKLSVYDFGTGGSRADAEKAEVAPAPSKKEGN